MYRMIPGCPEKYPGRVPRSPPAPLLGVCNTLASLLFHDFLSFLDLHTFLLCYTLGNISGAYSLSPFFSFFLFSFSRASTTGSCGGIKPQSLWYSSWFQRVKIMASYETSSHFPSLLKNKISCKRVL